VDLPAIGCYAWVAAESLVARAVRRLLVEERGVDKHWVKAAGYWRRGVVGAHDRIED
jgi:NADPH-dependent ferric siderophore reductase